MKLTEAPPSTQSTRMPASAVRWRRASAGVRERIWIMWWETESSCDRFPIGRRAVLAHLPFAFETFDADRDSDDALEEVVYVVWRRVGHLPRLFKLRFVRLGEAGDEGP